MRRISLIVFFLEILSSLGAQTKIIKSQTGYELIRNGKPYYVKGVDGQVNFDKMVEIGANSFRTWGIEDVGVKFATASGASTGEIKKSNTVINQWEELTFDFTSFIGHAAHTNIDQIIIFPDFKARTTDNICYIDNIRLGASTPVKNINVKFAVKSSDSTPVYVFGNWSNWTNFPGNPLTLNSSTGNYEGTISMPENTTIEYLYVNGNSTKEVLDPAWTCTNGNAQYTNRIGKLGTKDTSFCNKWKSCNSCEVTSTIINSLKDELSIDISKNNINIYSPSFTYIDGIEIYDLMGKSIFTKQGKIKTNSQIQLSLEESTIYIIKLNYNNTSHTIKTMITQ